MRWVETPGAEPARVYLHGLGAASAPYYAAAVAHPLLAGRRSLLVDLLGFGISDRPDDFSYTLEAHADTVALALRRAEVQGAEVIAHSMGGAVAIVLAARHPGLVSGLVLVDANLDPYPPPGGTGIIGFTEEEFVAGGWERVRDRVGPHWWATMRLSDLRALYRSAAGLAKGSTPGMRALLAGLAIPRVFLHPPGEAPARAAELRAAGVRVAEVPRTGHNIMLDNPQAFAEAVAAFPDHPPG